LDGCSGRRRSSRLLLASRHLAMTSTSRKLRKLRNAVEEDDANQGKLGPGE